MKSEVLTFKKIILIVLVAIFSYWLLNNIEILFNIIGRVFSVLSAFIVGGIIAFILNIPMRKIESILDKKIKNKKLLRGLSITLSFLLFVLVMAFVLFLLIPELVDNIKILINTLPTLIDKAEVFILDLLDKYPDAQDQIKKLFSNQANTNLITKVLNYILSGATTIISSLVSGFITIFTALIFSIYILSQKEYLIKGSKKVIYALTNKKQSERLIEIGNMINITFSKFISGQCLEAIILGMLMFMAFTICRFPYALLISVLTAVTALIPVFGAIIAQVIGFILIAITNPIQAIIFLIVFTIIQQIEGNFIYPKVVGKSVGLSPMWTLLAVLVGGNLFGVVGMIFGLPIASVIYALLKDMVNNKLKEKQVNLD